MNKTIERYQKREKEIGIGQKFAVDQDMQNGEEDAQSLAKKIESLEDCKQKLLGKGLEPCSLTELQQLENQLERSLSRIRDRKVPMNSTALPTFRKRKHLIPTKPPPTPLSKGYQLLPAFKNFHYKPNQMPQSFRNTKSRREKSHLQNCTPTQKNLARKSPYIE
ncbi:hypothetical protein V6N13_133741 [Hibiscus sabdariffa]